MSEGAGGKSPFLPLPKFSPRVVWQPDPSRSAGFVNANSFHGVVPPPPERQGAANGGLRSQNLQREAQITRAGSQDDGREVATTSGAGPALGAGLRTEELSVLLQKNLSALTAATATLGQLMQSVAAQAVRAGSVGGAPPNAAAGDAPVPAKSGAVRASPSTADTTPIKIYFRFNIIDGALALRKSRCCVGELPPPVFSVLATSHIARPAVVEINTNAGEFTINMYFEAAWAHEGGEARSGSIGASEDPAAL